MSDVVTLAVVGDNIAPYVVITSPDPNSIFTPYVPPSFDIRWRGEDPDGRIIRYKYRLFGASGQFTTHPDFVDWGVAHPDSFRDLFAPAFAGWDSVGAETTMARYTGVTPDETYLFAITAIDDRGDYDPVFSGSKNMLKLVVFAGAGLASPQLCVSGSFFNDCSETGGDRSLAYEIPADAAIAVRWTATAALGAEITGYRWVLDPKDTTSVGSRSPRSSDPNHWTAWSLANTSATIGPFGAKSDDQPVLYIQAKDSFARVSTVRIDFTVVHPTAARELLIVDDTRLTPDQLDASGAVAPPRGIWPTAAELDTFFYAKGGKPWRCYPGVNCDGSLQPGFEATYTRTTPGMFNGYDFDTLGTRGIASGVLPLSVLSRYRRVIWITDATGATYTGSPLETLAPITSLRLMSQPGQVNTLSTYSAQGGELWVLGGGAAYATLIRWGKGNTPADDWTWADGELRAGRFMYDFPHWRSAVGLRLARNALLNIPDWAPFGWNSKPSIGRGWSGQPQYDRLVNNPQVQMQILTGRTCATDPAPPLRFCDPFLFPRAYSAEFIGRPLLGSPPNFVVEDVDPRPNHERLESTLDTLYAAVGGTMPGPLPVMTYYHGLESGPVVFSGFPVWYFQRRQCQALVDFVLQDIWGLSKSPAATTAALAARRRAR